MRTAAYTLLALTAFAGNSVLCRLALHDGAIDPASFTLIRFASGAVVLVAAMVIVGGRLRAGEGSWRSAAVLFVYAVPFAFAYVSLAAGTGALILFGSVQLTMIGWALRSGERLHRTLSVGFLLALGGLVWLVSPGLSAPPLAGALWMAVAGVAWGAYSLLGRAAADPLAANAMTFVRALPLFAAVSLARFDTLHLQARGVWLAVASGVLASGLGYVVWYSALRGLTSTRAAVVQLAVPVLAAIGGMILLGESMTVRLAGSTLMVLGGIWLALLKKESV
jgi:drug/metabolite transporter (DMT)-like permease